MHFKKEKTNLHPGEIGTWNYAIFSYKKILLTGKLSNNLNDF